LETKTGLKVNAGKRALLREATEKHREIGAGSRWGGGGDVKWAANSSLSRKEFKLGPESKNPLKTPWTELGNSTVEKEKKKNGRGEPSE